MGTTLTGVNDSQLKDAVALFEATFGHAAAVVAAAPGRSEIAGNHTDHEGGHTIGGALDVAVVGVAAPNGTRQIRFVDAVYGQSQISLDEGLDPIKNEEVSTAGLIRGMAACLAATGRESAGFDIATTSTIPAGGGLSSSAAMESLLGRAMETLWPGDPVDPVELAKMGQRAENVYFGKPCGLLDQLSICLGGLAYMQFEDAAQPQTQKLELSFDDAGYALVLVDVGCDHAPFTADYAAVPVEMQAVAAELGHKRLCECDRADFDAKLPTLRKKLGDRAVLRAIHYWYENELVDQRWDALQAGDVEKFVELTRESGASSGMYLQNVSAGGDFQPAMLALGMAEHVLAGKGAIRIHGGGFGGSIQCFVPLDLLDGFMEQMNAWLGEGACRHYQIAPEGARAAWL